MINMKYWTIVDGNTKPCAVIYGELLHVKEFVDIVAYESLDGCKNYLDYCNHCIDFMKCIYDDIKLPLQIAEVDINITINPQN